MHIQSPVDPHAHVDGKHDLCEEEEAWSAQVQVVAQLQQVHRDVANVMRQQHKQPDSIEAHGRRHDWGEEEEAKDCSHEVSVGKGG